MPETRLPRRSWRPRAEDTVPRPRSSWRPLVGGSRESCSRLRLPFLVVAAEWMEGAGRGEIDERPRYVAGPRAESGAHVARHGTGGGEPDRAVGVALGDRKGGG